MLSVWHGRCCNILACVISLARTSTPLPYFFRFPSGIVLISVARESKPAEIHPSEELPEQETAVGGPCGGESSSLLRPEDDVSRARAETPLPKHPSLDTQPSNTGQPLLGDPSSGWLRWSTGSWRRNHLVWPLTGDLTSMGSPLPLRRAEQGLKAPLD
ncbi:hypothetical protein E2C01_090941 [Portunus trituberculatus]|uniref:Uncharacterized protein n=1 Tax=Portunus trituberculatus TaxID=210409 RepID=A0A5B7JRH0_PORTR|nr:hypothetical protein [Portunus trituberculatus]